MNGSSPMKLCSNASVKHNENTSLSRIFCTAQGGGPASSLLFDGLTPNLTGLDGDMWADQLLTMNVTTDRAVINFDFNITNYTGIDRVELSVFNCPQWRIAIDAVTIL